MKVYFIGAGPGDPQLITVKGRNLLEQADIVIYTGSLVPEKLLEYCRPDTERVDSAGMNFDEVCMIYYTQRENQGIIVRLHTGDPALYGAIQEQIDQLCAWNIPFSIVPGVSSFQAASAVLERQFTLPGVSQTIILTRMEGRTDVPESERLEILAKSRATLVIFLSVHRAEEIQRRLVPILGEETPVAVVYRVTWEDQAILKGRLGTLHRLCDEAGITRHALIVIGRVLAGEYEKSKLYSAAFSHGYRQVHP